MEEGNDLRKMEVRYSENFLKFPEKSAIILVYNCIVG